MKGNLPEKESYVSFNVAKIDSFTVRIPLNCLQIVSTTFGQKYGRFYESGEIGIEHIKTKRSSSKLKVVDEDDPVFYEYDRVRLVEDEDTCTFLKYKMCDTYVPGSIKPVTCIQLMITSKIRTVRYFDGLNMDSLKEIHNRIIEDGIISLTFDAFLEGFVSDIDVCVDYRTDDKEFASLKDLMFREVIESKSKYVFSKRVFKGKDCFGIMFNERHKATPSCPFGKLYFKSKELYSDGTIDFTKRNLLGYSNDIEAGISRVEFTIKGYKHKSRLGIESVVTLSDLMSLDQARLKEIFLVMVSEYYNKKDRSVMSDNDSFKMSLLLFNGFYLMDRSITSTRIFNAVYGYYGSKMTPKQRHDFKKKFNELVELSEFSSKIKENDKKNEVVNSVMVDLGIYEDR